MNRSQTGKAIVSTKIPTVFFKDCWDLNIKRSIVMPFFVSLDQHIHYKHELAPFYILQNSEKM